MRIHTVRLPPLPFEIELALAAAENDRDIACGGALTGPELDFRETLDRRIAAAEDSAFLFGTVDPRPLVAS